MPRDTARSGPVPTVVAALLVVLVLVPLGVVVRAGLDPGQLGRAFAVLTSEGVLLDTFVFVAGATLLSVALGASAAWLTERTDLPLRRVVRVAVLVPLVIPGVLTTAAWRLLLSDRIGLLNLALDALGPGGPRTDAHTLGAMVWVAGVDGMTLPFLLVAAALRGLDPSLEEAALVAGDRRRAATRIVLPFLVPAMAASTLVTVIRHLGRFEGPVILGLPGGVRVLPSQILLVLQTFPRDLDLAAAFSLLLLVASLVLFGLYLRMTGVAGRFATIGGRARAPRRWPLRHRRATAAAVLLVLGVTVVAPIAVLLYASFLPYYAPPSGDVLAGATLGNYAALVASGPVLVPVLRRTLLVGVAAASLAVLIGVVAARTSLRDRTGWRRLLDPVATMPVAVPGVVLALAALWLLLRSPVPLYGSLAAVALGLTVLSLPHATRAAEVALVRIAPELEEASAVAGARPSRTLVRIVGPLALPGLLAGVVVVMSRSAAILSLPLLVGGPGDEVLAVHLLRLLELARFPELSALGVLIVAALAAVAAGVAAVQRWRERRVVMPA